MRVIDKEPGENVLHVDENLAPRGREDISRGCCAGVSHRGLLADLVDRE